MTETGVRVAVLVVSDRAASGERPDATGPALAELLRDRRAEVVAVEVVADDKAAIAAAIIAHSTRADVVLTAGGTGLSARDVTPDITAELIERPVPGIAEAMRAEGLRHTPHAMLSRAVAGVRGQCLIINLPGSPRGATESLAAIWPAIPHAVAVITGPVGDEEHRLL